MAARIVHFGADDCQRLTVLSSAGYTVEASGTSISLFKSLLTQEACDAIAISEDHLECDGEVVSLSRSLSQAPIILFEGINRQSEVPAVDLTIHTGMSPAEWLTAIHAIIQRSKEVCAEAKTTRRQSAELRKESRVLRAEATSARHKAAEEHRRAEANSKKKQ